MSEEILVSSYLSPASLRAPVNFVETAWLRHAPFAFHVMATLKPRVFVELGTHAGFSYLCFCQAIRENGVGATTYAIDTWAGDEHAGFYSEQIFEALRQLNEPYEAFSTLLRMRFDEALPYFPDGSIDLLHIDGRHYYSDVKEDFESWLPKLSKNAIVLFHDTNVRERDFGVFRLFQELGRTYRTFEFFHGHGLGILAVGEPPTALKPFFDADEQQAVFFRQLYAELGSHVVSMALAAHLTKSLDQTHRELAAVRDNLAQESRLGDDARRQVADLMARGDRLVETERQLRSELETARSERNAMQHLIEQLEIAAKNVEEASSETLRQSELGFQRELGALQLEIDHARDDAKQARNQLSDAQKNLEESRQSVHRLAAGLHEAQCCLAEMLNLIEQTNRRLVSSKFRALAIKTAAAYRHPFNRDKRRGFRAKFFDLHSRSWKTLTTPDGERDITDIIAIQPLPVRETIPLSDHSSVAEDAPLVSTPLFDSEWYLHHNPDIKQSGEDPYRHFMDKGWKEGRNPSPYFDVKWYLDRYGDIQSADVNPFEHYVSWGWKELRDPSPNFSVAFYLDANRDIASAGIEPYGHYIMHGRVEGRPARRSVMQTASYKGYVQATRWNLRQENALKDRLAAVADRLPLISVLVPVFNTPPRWLSKAIESVRSQIYQNFEICISDNASTDPSVRETLEAFKAKDQRIKVHYRQDNGHICRNTNDAFTLSSGDVIVLFDSDDELSWDALAEIALAFAEESDVDYVYSDCDKIRETGERFDPHFKPDWSPELLLTYMYAGQCLCVRRDIWSQLGGMRIGYEGCQDHDFALRATEISRKIRHIPRVLYHWRSHAGSTASATEGGAQKPYTFEAGRKAIQDALDRKNSAGIVTRPDFAVRKGNAFYEIQFPNEGPSVSIIIPTHTETNILRTCIESLQKTTYRNFEIVIVGDEWVRPDVEAELSTFGSKVLWWSHPDNVFNFSQKMNWAISQVTSEYVLLLNDDTEVVNPNWLSSMVGYAMLPRVGVVGALLRYPDGRVQHAGILSGLEGGSCDHAFKLAGKNDRGYYSLISAARNCSAVTAACMLTPRKLYLDVGGLNENEFGVAFNDPDYCFRLYDKGYRIVYTPTAELLHYDGVTRGFVDNPDEEAAYRKRFGDRIDPYFNPNFSRSDVNFVVTPTVTGPQANEKIRVAFMTHNLNWEGAPRHVFNLVSELARNGAIEPVVLSLADGPLGAELANQGIVVTILPPTPSWQCGIDSYRNWLNLVESELAAHRVSSVFANTLECFFGVDAAKNIGIASIWNIHESEGEKYFHKWSDELKSVALSCFSKAYRLVFVAKSTSQIYSMFDKNGVSTTIKNGYVPPSGSKPTRLEARGRLGLDADAVVILSVGTVCERKAQIDLIRALARVSPDDAKRMKRMKIFIVGDRPGSYSDAMHLEIEQLREDLRDKLVVVKETGDVAQYYAAAEIFICASRLESYPSVIMEAMGAGLAIITTPVFGITEQVREGENALFFDPGDVETLHRHLVELVDNDHLRARMCAFSPRQLKSLPSYDLMIQTYGKIIAEAARASVFA